MGLIGGMESASVKEAVFFFNYREEDPTKRLKLAGVRRYAAAAGWNVAPVECGMSDPKSIRALLARDLPAGCIFDCDGDPSGVRPRHFGRTPVVFAGGASRGFGPRACPVGVDNAAIAASAFRELSAGAPKACAVAACMEPAPWASERVAAFTALAKAEGLPCFVFRRKRGESMDSRDFRFSAWFADLPPHTAIFGVNDLSARIVARAAMSAGLSVPRDFTLVGVDNDHALCESEAPSLTSLQLDFERMGYLVAKALGKMMALRSQRQLSTAFDRHQIDSHRTRSDAIEKSAPIAIGPLLAVRRESTQGGGLFPSGFLHLGGDECPTTRWKACPRCQTRMRAEGLPDESALLGWLTRRLVRHLEGRGRRAVVWNEALHCGALPPSVVVQVWQGDAAADAAAAARKGHDVILSPMLETYFSIPEGLPGDPYRYRAWVMKNGWTLPAGRVRAFDPLAYVPPELSGKVLGAECCAWSEVIHDRAELEYKVSSRLAAFGEAMLREIP